MTPEEIEDFLTQTSPSILTQVAAEVAKFNTNVLETSKTTITVDSTPIRPATTNPTMASTAKGKVQPPRPSNMLKEGAGNAKQHKKTQPRTIEESILESVRLVLILFWSLHT